MVVILKSKRILTYIIIIGLALFLGINDTADELDSGTYRDSEILPSAIINESLSTKTIEPDPIGTNDTGGIIGSSTIHEDDTFTDATENEADSINPEDTNLSGPYTVSRVVDGDTIILDIDGTSERLRLIGIDTPESVHPDGERNVEYGKIASAYTTSMLEEQNVFIELDVQERDRYGRLLAYVYIDGIMLNKLLLQEGHAMVSTYPPNVKYIEDFTALQEKARENGYGLWNQSN
jgi:endonuclease YncB( thermonuclease family)